MEKEKEENIWRGSLQKLSRILRSLGLETFANLRRDSVSDSVNFVSVLALKNLVSEKKYQYRRIWCRFFVLENSVSLEKKSLGMGFGQNFGIVIP